MIYGDKEFNDKREGIGISPSCWERLVAALKTRARSADRWLWAHRIELLRKMDTKYRTGKGKGLVLLCSAISAVHLSRKH